MIRRKQVLGGVVLVVGLLIGMFIPTGISELLTQVASAATQATTLHQAYEIAYKAVLQWDQSAHPYNIMSVDSPQASPEETDANQGRDGRRTRWNVWFRSLECQERLVVSVVNGKIAGQKSFADPLEIPVFEDLNDVLDSDAMLDLIPATIRGRPDWAIGIHFRLTHDETGCPTLVVQGTDDSRSPVVLSFHARSGELLSVVRQVALGGGLFLSEDGGETWHISDKETLGFDPWVVAISPDYATDQTLFVGSALGLDEAAFLNKQPMKVDIYRSTDGGKTWLAANGNFGKMGVIKILPSPAFTVDGTLFAATADAGVFRSTDRGRSWQPINAGLPQLEVSDLVLSPSFAQDHTLYVSLFDFYTTRTRYHGIYRSADGGESWQLLLPVQASALALLDSYPKDVRLLIGTEQGMLQWVSEEAQAKPLAVEDAPSDLIVRLATVKTKVGQRIWMGTHQGLHYWNPEKDAMIKSSLPVPTAWQIAVSPNFLQDQTLFVGGFRTGILRSTDGGVSWKQICTGMECLGDAIPRSLDVKLANDQMIVAATMGSAIIWTEVSDIP